MVFESDTYFAWMKTLKNLETNKVSIFISVDMVFLENIVFEIDKTGFLISVP